MSLAKIGRKKDLGDRSAADPRVSQFVTDQFFQLFTEALGDAFVPMGVHVFRIQYVRENCGVFATAPGHLVAAAPCVLRVRPSRWHGESHCASRATRDSLPRDCP